MIDVPGEATIMAGGKPQKSGLTATFPKHAKARDIPIRLRSQAHENLGCSGDPGLQQTFGRFRLGVDNWCNGIGAA